MDFALTGSKIWWKFCVKLLDGTIMLLIVYELDGITSQTKRIGFCDGAMNSEAHHFFLKMDP